MREVLKTTIVGHRLMKIIQIFGNLEKKQFPSPLRSCSVASVARIQAGIKVENLSSERMKDIDGMTVRKNRFMLSKDDAFRIDDGFISHIKIVMSENV